MGDRLDTIEEILKEGLSRGPDDRYYHTMMLILEELRYLRDQISHAKNAAREFARLMP